MSDAVLDLSVPHLRLVSLKLSPFVKPIKSSKLFLDYFVVRGYMAPDGRLMIRRQPSATLGQPSHPTQLPRTDNAPEGPAYDVDTNNLTKFQDRAAVIDRADPQYTYLMAEVEEPNPTHPA